MAYWLLKSEPDVYGIEDLKKAEKQTDCWDGVRNYQARNLMKEMRKGDQAFFYHSNCQPPGIAGLIEIAKEAYPDHTAFDSKEKYYDPKSNPENPRWFMVDVTYKRHLKRHIPLNELRGQKPLSEFKLLQKGNRLSIMPVTEKEWHYILSLENA